MSTWPQLLESVKSLEWRDRIRPLGAFVDPQRFGRVRTVLEIQARATLNLHHFLINYILLGIVVLVFACALRPLLLFGLVAAAGISAYSASRESIQIPGLPPLQGQHKHAAALGMSLFVVLLFAGPSVFVVVGLSVSLIMLHSVFYIPDPEAMHEEIENEKQMELP